MEFENLESKSNELIHFLQDHGYCSTVISNVSNVTKIILMNARQNNGNPIWMSTVSIKHRGVPRMFFVTKDTFFE